MKIENLEKAKDYYTVVEFLKKFRSKQVIYLSSNECSIVDLANQDEFIKILLSDLRTGIVDLENKLLNKIE